MSSYFSGTAASFAGLQGGIIAACVADGWTAVTADIISKGDCFIQLSNTATWLAARAGLGQSGGALVTPNPALVYCKDICSGGALVFPINYEVHVTPTGVVAVANFAADRYMYLMFGQDPVAGLPGKGVWISASQGSTAFGTVSWTGTGFNGSLSVGWVGTGPFLCEAVNSGALFNSYVHHGLDGGAWSDSAGVAGRAPSTGAKSTGGFCTLMVKYSPNAWNNEATLFPVQPYITRGSNKMSFIADIDAIRYLRIDNYMPGDIITIGTDKWKVYPVYKKNSTLRLLAANSSAFQHSGTIGYAVRYYGP